MFIITTYEKDNRVLSRLHISGDGGENFHHKDLEFYIEKDLKFHPSNDAYIMTLSNSVRAFFARQTALA